MNYDDIHEWLLAALPATSEKLLRELEKLHRLLPKSYVGFPKTDVELIAVLKTMLERGMVAQCSPHLPEDMLAVWRYTTPKPKPEPQRALFT